MASDQKYLQYIVGQFEDSDEISYRAMMGEYVLYSRGKIFGGIYDDRLLIKPTQAAAAYLQTVRYEQPYPGANPMLLVENTDDRDFLRGLLRAVWEELPFCKRKEKLFAYQ